MIQNHFTKILHNLLLTHVVLLSIVYKYAHVPLLILVPCLIYFYIKYKNNNTSLHLLWEKHKKIWLLSTLYVCLTIIGYFYSEDKKEAIRVINLSITFIYSFGVYLCIPDKKKITPTLIRFFTLACIASFGINLIWAGLNWYISCEDFTFHHLTYTKLALTDHPSYLSSFYSIALILLLQDKKKNRVKTIQLIALVLAIILMGSKANILALGVILLLYTLHQISFKNTQQIVWIIITTLGIILIGTQTDTMTRFKHIDFKMWNNQEAKDLEDLKSTDLRVYVWKKALMKSKEAPLFGFGTGDFKTAVYQNNHIGKTKASAHNQFIEELLTKGLLGLILLILWIYFLHQNLKTLNTFSAHALLMLIVINLLTLSMFNRLSGVLFFICIHLFLLFHPATTLSNTKDI